MPDTSASLLVLAAACATYALAACVAVSYRGGQASLRTLALGPMLALAPLAAVPAMVAVAEVGAAAVTGSASSLRAAGRAWRSLVPVAIVAALATDATPLSPVTLGLALVMGGAVRFALSGGRRRSALLDVALAPPATVVATVTVESPWLIGGLAPFIYLLWTLARERGSKEEADRALDGAYRGTVELLADVVEHDDAYTGSHCRAVVELALEVGRTVGIQDRDLARLEFAALLHDVGKLAIPNEVLNKPGALSDEEFGLMKTHTVEGQVILDQVGGLLGDVGTIVRSCHERWDGRGYPDGLAGDAIPLAARVVFCCDAFNAMTTDRPYRAGMSIHDALAELEANAGAQFDPAIAATLTRVIRARGRITADREPAGHAQQALAA